MPSLDWEDEDIPDGVDPKTAPVLITNRATGLSYERGGPGAVPAVANPRLLASDIDRTRVSAFHAAASTA